MCDAEDRIQLHFLSIQTQKGFQLTYSWIPEDADLRSEFPALTCHCLRLLCDLWNNQIFTGPIGELASTEKWHVQTVPLYGGFLNTDGYIRWLRNLDPVSPLITEQSNLQLYSFSFLLPCLSNRFSRILCKVKLQKEELQCLMKINIQYSMQKNNLGRLWFRFCLERFWKITKPSLPHIRRTV